MIGPGSPEVPRGPEYGEGGGKGVQGRQMGPGSQGYQGAQGGQRYRSCCVQSVDGAQILGYQGVRGIRGGDQIVRGAQRVQKYQGPGCSVCPGAIDTQYTVTSVTPRPSNTLSSLVPLDHPAARY